MESSWGMTVLGMFTPIVLVIGLVLAIHLFVRRQRARKRYSPLTEAMLRTPGQHLEEEQSKLEEKLYLGVTTVLLFPVVVYVGARSSLVAWAIVVIIVGIGVWSLFRTFSKALNLRLAIDGEQYTGLELNYLMRNGAWVFHDIPYQYGNIDHIVVSTGGVFAVETKTYRKPAGAREGSREYKVTRNGNTLEFPHFRTSEPIEQARRHAKHVQSSIRNNLGITVPVTPVVALPGWFVEPSPKIDVRVINPKRGGALAAQVQQDTVSPQQAELIANYIESVARSVPAGSKKMDPDASKFYDFWNKRRFEERKLGQ